MSIFSSEGINIVMSEYRFSSHSENCDNVTQGGSPNSGLQWLQGFSIGVGLVHYAIGKSQ